GFFTFHTKVSMASSDPETRGSEDVQDISSDYELEYAMEHNCLADTLSGYQESCKPFSVTDPKSSKNLGA
nr:AWS-like protein [Tanacetum cinerariifolium]